MDFNQEKCADIATSAQGLCRLLSTAWQFRRGQKMNALFEVADGLLIFVDEDTMFLGKW